jgi:hypothetical protein
MVTEIHLGKYGNTAVYGTVLLVLRSVEGLMVLAGVFRLALVLGECGNNALIWCMMVIRYIMRWFYVDNHSLLRHCTTSQNVVGSRLDEVIDSPVDLILPATLWP